MSPLKTIHPARIAGEESGICNLLILQLKKMDSDGTHVRGNHFFFIVFLNLFVDLDVALPS